MWKSPDKIFALWTIDMVVADNHVRSDLASGMVNAKVGKSPMSDIKCELEASKWLNLVDFHG